MRRNDVVILGAGFSKAISEVMPVLDELGTASIQLTESRKGTQIAHPDFFEGFTFENWLATLAEDQPYLSAAENAENTATFLNLRDAMVEILSVAESTAFDGSPPNWLEPLTLLLHHRQATVMTFNYDRLLEMSLERLNVLYPSPFEGFQHVSVRDTLWDRPPEIDGPAETALLETFRLLKLHGSLDWWIAPHDPSGSTLRRERFNLRDGNPEILTEVRRGQFLPGRDVFIVPPTLSKAPYYQNMVTRELWRASYDALKQATHVAIVGYSMPEADVLTTGLLEKATRGRHVQIEVVNTKPGAIANRLRHLGIEEVIEFGGDNCVADFVAQYIDRGMKDLMNLLRPHGSLAGPSLPVIVTTRMFDSDHVFFRVVSLEHNESSGEVTLTAVPRGINILNAAGAGGVGPEDVVSQSMWHQLMAAMPECSSLVIRAVDRTLVPVDGAQAFPPYGGGPIGLLLSAIEVPANLNSTDGL